VQARGYRLGAMQRKFPALGVYLLYLLAFVELLAFPLLGAGSAGARAHIRPATRYCCLRRSEGSRAILCAGHAALS
jgi:hypothetical protein